jgi:hypothetical protein
VPPDPASTAYGLTTALWLRLLYDSLLFVEYHNDSIILLPGLPVAWLEREGMLEVTNARTAYGMLNLHASWQANSDRLLLNIDLHNIVPYFLGFALRLPRLTATVIVDGKEFYVDPPLPNTRQFFPLPPNARQVVVQFAQ